MHEELRSQLRANVALAGGRADTTAQRRRSVQPAAPRTASALRRKPSARTNQPNKLPALGAATRSSKRAALTRSTQRGIEPNAALPRQTTAFSTASSSRRRGRQQQVTSREKDQSDGEEPKRLKKCRGGAQSRVSKLRAFLNAQYTELAQTKQGQVSGGRLIDCCVYSDDCCVYSDGCCVYSDGCCVYSDGYRLFCGSAGVELCPIQCGRGCC